MTSPRARVSLVGLGPIGIEVGKALAGREGIELSGAADPAPDKAGRPLASLLDGAFPGVAVRPRRRRSTARPRSSRSRWTWPSSAPARACHVDAAADRRGHRSGPPHRVDVRRAGLPGAAPRSARAADRPDGEGEGRRRPRHRRQPGPRHGPARARRRHRLRARRLGPRHARRGRRQAARAAAREGRAPGSTREEFAAGVSAKKLGHVGLSESAAIIALGLGLPDRRDHRDDQARHRAEGHRRDAGRRRPGAAPGRSGAGGRRSQGGARSQDGRRRARSRRSDRHRGRSAPAPRGCRRFPRRPLDDRDASSTRSPSIVAAAPGLHNVVTLPLFGLRPLF